jgi:hypothetical protein
VPQPTTLPRAKLQRYVSRRRIQASCRLVNSATSRADGHRETAVSFRLVPAVCLDWRDPVPWGQCDRCVMGAPVSSASALLWVGIGNLWLAPHRANLLEDIWGSHGYDYEDYRLLGCYAVQTEAPSFSETLVTYQTGRCHIPEENNLHIAISRCIARNKLCLEW